MVPADQLEVNLYNALIAAFSVDSMTLMLRNRLGIDLENEVDLHQGRKFIFSDLLKVSNQQGWRDDLVRGALVENTGNFQLKLAAAGFGLTPPVPTSQPPSGSVPVGQLDQARLEKVARERGVTIKFAEYSVKLTALARRMCLVEIPGVSQGTGWLVAPNLVLTNYHVIEDVDKNRAARTDVVCTFDYFKDRAQGPKYGLAESWLVDSSPYALADIRADAPDPTPDELDYALLVLSRPAGDEAMTRGEKRGWVTVTAASPVIVAEDIVMVPQFPDGRSLELSFGQALAYNKSNTRLRYDANTEEGASGSPVVTMAIEPFGLHHAGGPGRAQKYNQCVPLRLIVRRIAKNQQTPHFWQGDPGGEG